MSEEYSAEESKYSSLWENMSELIENPEFKK